MSKKPTILYVEDDPNDAVAFERALKKSGLPLDLQIAPDGKFAIEYFAGEHPYTDREKYPLPKIVVSDMKMYRMNGLELLEWIRSQPRFRDLPVVLYSSSNEDSDVSPAAAAGATAYFRKTFNCVDVIEFLKGWLAEKTVAKRVTPRSAVKTKAKPERRAE